MIQQKDRKKKRPFVMLIFSTFSHRIKQNVFIKNLAILPCDSRIVRVD